MPRKPYTQSTSRSPSRLRPHRSPEACRYRALFYVHAPARIQHRVHEAQARLLKAKGIDVGADECMETFWQALEEHYVDYRQSLRTRNINPTHLATLDDVAIQHIIDQYIERHGRPHNAPSNKYRDFIQYYFRIVHHARTKNKMSFRQIVHLLAERFAYVVSVESLRKYYYSALSDLGTSTSDASEEETTAGA